MEKKLLAEAVLVEDGRIQLVGSEALVFDSRSEDAQLIHLHGHTLMPAFMDGHSHLTALASTLNLVALEGTHSFEEICERIITYIKERYGRSDDGKTRESEISQSPVWVIGFGYDHNFLKERMHPDAAVLDRVNEALAASGFDGDYTIVIGHTSGHMGVANSRALSLLGLNRETPDPKGGKIGRWPDGRPNGYLEETAFTDLTSGMSRPDQAQMMKNLSAAEEIYLSHGITTIQDGLTKAPEWDMLKMMADHEAFKADVVAYVDIKDNARIMDENPEYVGKYKNHLKIGGYKLFLDGSPQGRTAWMQEPYLNSGDYKGYPIYSDQQVETYVKKSADEGRQLIVHCNGDAAAQQLIDACEHVAAHGGRLDRPVMIHAQLVQEKQLEKMARLGMIASFFVAHTYYWGDIHLKNFGNERAEKISPVRTAQSLEVTTTFHQDTPVLPPDMIDTLWCALNRVTKEGCLLDPNERPDMVDALSCITDQCAYQYFEENEKGSIAAGKLADFVILSENPLEVEPEAVKSIQVLETIKGGVTVWKK